MPLPVQASQIKEQLGSPCSSQHCSVLAASVRDSSASLIKNPYWGGAGAKFPWKHSGLPEGPYEQFGSTETAASGLISDLALTGLLDPNQNVAGADPDKPVAQTSFSDAVDRLWTTGARDLDKRLSARMCIFHSLSPDQSDASSIEKKQSVRRRRLQVASSVRDQEWSGSNAPLRRRALFDTLRHETPRPSKAYRVS